jgi:hypothetical protein
LLPTRYYTLTKVLEREQVSEEIIILASASKKPLSQNLWAIEQRDTPALKVDILATMRTRL